MEEQLDTMEDQLDGYKQEKELSYQLIGELQAELKDLKSDYTKLEDQKRELEDKIFDLQETNEQLNQKMIALVQNFE